VSYAPQIGAALAPGEPRAAATAILRIEALAAAPFAKPLNVRGIGGTESTVRDIAPPHVQRSGLGTLSINSWKELALRSRVPCTYGDGK
jgi:hypothetical protein